MKIEILGSGGATVTPRPFSQLPVSQKARQQGHPYTRMGPAYFIHDSAFLIDTPEEIGLMLERSRIHHVAAATYSHWHPDHTGGVRVWESNSKMWGNPEKSTCTDIYLPYQVAKDFQQWLGLYERLNYHEHKQNVIRRIYLEENESFEVGNMTFQPLLLAVGYVYGFLISQGNKRALIIPDEAFGWIPPADLPPLDLLIMPSGLFEFHPVTHDRQIPADHEILQTEATFEQTLGMLRRVKSSQTVLSHIEEVNNLDYDDLLRLSEKLRVENPELGNISFAYDMQIIEI